MGEFLSVCPKRQCISTVGTRTDLFGRDPDQVPITDFFGSVRNVELTTEVINDQIESQSLNSQEERCEKDSCGEHVREQKTYTYIRTLPVLEELGLVVM